MATSLNGLLLRLPSMSFSAAARLAGPALELKPLFPMTAGLQALGVASDDRQWYAAALKESADGANAWDVVHDAVARLTLDTALVDGAPDLIEPDLVQPWIHQDPSQAEVFGVADDCRFDDQNSDWPRRPLEFAWHLGDRFSQLRKARAEVGQGGSQVRIVHLDTGYDAEHATLSNRQLDAHLQKNFIDGNDDARDRGVDGVLKNPGHGTGTLSILAGGHFQFTQNGYQFDEELGGAPEARIVPVRIGNSVVQLTTSAVAQGIAYAASLCDDQATRVHVMSMSMGGVASAAWADAVNKAYEAGIVFVAAAGNNVSAGWFGGFPTRHIVYPARFRRVIAACGVMADRRPYYGLRTGMIQGNWGPEGAMASALAAFTPNIAWARWGCEKIVRMNGEGTSSATPQIAAAVALYLQKHAGLLFDVGRYPEPWMRVEAVRQALFLSAERPSSEAREKLGNGILRAVAALHAPPAKRQSLIKTREDDAGFPFLNVLSDAGLTGSREQAMLKLEATQLVHRWSSRDKPNPLEEAVPDPDRPQGDVPPDRVRHFLEAVSEHREASKKLRARAKAVLDGMVRRGGATPRKPPLRKTSDSQKPLAETAPVLTIKQAVFEPPPPPYRKLRGYAVDPTLTTILETVGIGEITFKVPWEPLRPGPVGEYLEVIDIDPASKSFYEPVDLDDPRLLAQDGLPPSDGVPQFHQQMTYAACSLTINNFEHALGRKSLWRPQHSGPGENPHDDSGFVQRLRIYPHALREANAYYSPQKVALLFGYFRAKTTDPREHLPGGRVFTCLSHDIIAHETTHALLDGMHRRFLLPTNPDVRAFHEGFADCVAMLQRFTFPDLLAHQIANTRGQLDAQENLLVQLAIQFGRATGKRMALRDAIGHFNETTNTWSLRPPDPEEYRSTSRPHERGRILVAAVFDALLSIYRRRTADLIRLASEGTGILRPGTIHPDLVGRLADEAAKSAQHVLTMIIRALDYCPPTDITFGEYLRAIITADYDLVSDDYLNYRVAFIEAFRRRGIFPPDVESLSVGSLLWRTANEEAYTPSRAVLERLRWLRDPGTEHFYAQTRAEVFHLQRSMRLEMHRWLESHFASGEAGRRDAEFLGIDPRRGSFEVHMARVAYRSRPDGGILPQLLVGLLQRTNRPIDPKAPNGPKMAFEGGSTIIADLREQKVRYCIRKRLNSDSRLSDQQKFALTDFDSLHATYLGERALDGALSEPQLLAREQFALLHREPRANRDRFKRRQSFFPVQIQPEAKSPAMAKKTVAKTAKKKTPKTAKKKFAETKTAKVKKKKSVKTALPKLRVRMFRQGLGDCFLVTFDVGRDEKHMLIDSGTLGNKRTNVKIPDVAKEIESTIGRGRLDIVVATHEHKDHISGFRNTEMRKLEGQVGNVWLAWTENPEDEDAKKFAKYKDDLGQALAAVAFAAADSAEGQQIAHLLGFAGTVAGMDDLEDTDTNANADMLGADFAKTVHEAMEFVRLKLAPSPSYWDPGQIIAEDWLPGFRIYVLGPPRGKESMADMGGHDSEELYHVATALRSAARLHFAADEMSAEERAECARELPFDQRFVERGEELMRFRYPAYFADPDEWRQIDIDWLSAATDLALQLDKLTNNSSLALAIERIADGKVLLFPADAQQGNWLSWHGLQWTVPGKSRSVVVEDLLKRTVFYKVGHHASHNATLRDKGLELMPHGELTALIPVDREIALSRNPKGSWQMPAFHLYRRLLEVCDGRVARSDLGWASPPEQEDSVEESFSSLASEDEWNAWAAKQKEAEKIGQVSVRSNHIDYLLG